MATITLCQTMPPREVAELDARIARQKAIIERLKQNGAPVDKATDNLLQMELLLLDLQGRAGQVHAAEWPLAKKRVARADRGIIQCS